MTTTTERPWTAPADTTRTRRALPPEAEQIRRAALGVATWDPTRPTEIHEQLAGLALDAGALAASALVYVETLAGHGLSPRLLADLTAVCESLAAVGVDLSRIDRRFVQLYAGQLEQDTQPVKPLVFGRR